MVPTAMSLYYEDSITGSGLAALQGFHGGMEVF
jgi:hypothetical protein